MTVKLDGGRGEGQIFFNEEAIDASQISGVYTCAVSELPEIRINKGICSYTECCFRPQGAEVAAWVTMGRRAPGSGLAIIDCRQG